MKKILFIIGLFVTVLLAIPSDEDISPEETIATEQQARLEGQNDGKDMQKRFEQISKDMRDSNCLTPRRPMQSTYVMTQLRVIRNAVRTIQDIRIKEVSQLLRVNEFEILRQTINYYSLLCHKGYHVYALRKIVI